MNRNLKLILQFIVFLGLGIGILYWLYTTQETTYQNYCQEQNIPASECSFTGKLLDDFSKVKWAWIVLVMGLYMMSNISRMQRWRMMLKSIGYPMSFKTAFIATMTGYFANSLVARSGEIARAGYAAHQENIPIEKTFGTIAVDRSIDLLSLAIVILIGFALEYDILFNYISENIKVPGGSLLQSPIVLTVLVLAALGFLSIILFRNKLKNNKIFLFFLEKMKGFWEGITSVKKVKNPLLFLFHSLNIWVMYYLMTYVAFWSFAPTEHLSMAAGLVVFIFGTLGIIIPTPGGMGAYQVLVSTCLFQFYGIEEFDAFSFSNIVFFPIYFLNIFIGILLLPFVFKYFTAEKNKNETQEPILENVT